MASYEISGYTNRLTKAKSFLKVTFALSFIALPIIFISLETTCLLGLVAIGFLVAAIWQCILAETVWHKIERDIFST